MEVHHHSSRPGGTRKKWTHYFWEFLMLFLAVFCGFLAEYQLEHKIERDRAKEFATLLIEDLKEDTAAISRQIRFRNRIYASADSLMQYLKYKSFDDNLDKISEFYSVINNRNILVSNKGTIEQMKHSGALRYFKNKAMVGSIIKYYNRLEYINHRIEYLFDYDLKIMAPFNQRHFDRRYEDTSYSKMRNIKPFKNLKEPEIAEFYNIAWNVQRLNEALATPILPDASRHAIDLIELIKNEFHLK